MCCVGERASLYNYPWYHWELIFWLLFITKWKPPNVCEGYVEYLLAQILTFLNAAHVCKELLSFAFGTRAYWRRIHSLRASSIIVIKLVLELYNIELTLSGEEVDEREREMQLTITSFRLANYEALFRSYSPSFGWYVAWTVHFVHRLIFSHAHWLLSAAFSFFTGIWFRVNSCLSHIFVMFSSIRMKVRSLRRMPALRVLCDKRLFAF